MKCLTNFLLDSIRTKKDSIGAPVLIAVHITKKSNANAMIALLVSTD